MLGDVISSFNIAFIAPNIDEIVVKTHLRWLNLLHAADRFPACTKSCLYDVMYILVHP